MKSKNDNKLLENLLKVATIDEIEKSNLRIELYNIKISYYEKLLENLKSKKPFKFQKRKIDNYTKQQNKYIAEINILHSKIDEEVDLIMKYYSTL